jgi:hypothetical protein
MSSFRAPPRKGENFELSADLNSEYKDKRKDAIKRVIANMTVQKGAYTHVLRPCGPHIDLIPRRQWPLSRRAQEHADRRPRAEETCVSVSYELC